MVPPVEAVLSEAGLCSVQRVMESLWLRELEKCLRAPAGNPRHVWNFGFGEENAGEEYRLVYGCMAVAEGGCAGGHGAC